MVGDGGKRRIGLGIGELEEGRVIKRLIFISVGLMLLVGLVFLVWDSRKENTILKQALHQQEQMIKQREEQIQRLQERLDTLQKEQVLREKKIMMLKQRQEQIQKPRTTEEMVKEFKELGYEATVR